MNDRQTDSYVAGVESVSGVPLAQTRPNSLLLSLSLGLTGLTTLSLARTPDGHGTRDVGPSPQSKKAETLPAAGLESGHESHLSQPSGDGTPRFACLGQEDVGKV